jgi:probable F420-dependent oxidoreductase
MHMKFGILAPQMGWNAGPDALRDVAQAAEELGFASVWTADHIAMPSDYVSEYPFNDEGRFPVPGARPFYDMFPTLGFLSAVTSRVLLGVAVCVVPYRHPSLLAKSVTSVDQLCKGRFIFGAGIGWLKEEFQALGMDYHTRGRDTDEALELLRTAWSEEQPVSFHGNKYVLDKVYFSPGPYQNRRIPIWMGGVTDPALRRTGRFADTWFPHLFGADPDGMARSQEVIRRVAEEHGRGGEHISTAMFLPLQLADRTEDPDTPAWRKRLYVASPDDLVATLRRYEEVGLDHVLIAMGGNTAEKLRDIEVIAREVMPALPDRDEASATEQDAAARS